MKDIASDHFYDIDNPPKIHNALLISVVDWPEFFLG